MRENLVNAQNYIEKGEAHQRANDPTKTFERDVKMEHIAMVLRREIPMRWHAHRSDDILTALRIRDEFGFDTFIDQYNRERPHQGLGMKVPADVYARVSEIRSANSSRRGPYLCVRSRENRDRTSHE